MNETSTPDSTTGPAGRPWPVTVLVVLQIILGVFSFFGGFVHVFAGYGGLVGFAGSNVQLGGVAEGLGASLVLFGILFVACAALEVKMHPSAWRFAVVVGLLGLLVGVASLALGTAGAVPGILLAVAILYLLTRGDVKTYLLRLPGSP